MHIDSYKFGEMVIDGKSYRNDVIIVGDEVNGDWWRQKGHEVWPGDLEDVVSGRCELLIIGSGASGMVTVPDETREFLKGHGIDLEVFRTGKAVERFNELRDNGQSAAGGFHLTC